MKLAIMQPYFFPYIGYWQLLNAVDRFVIYDDVNFIKGGWINRNRILINGKASYITVPLHHASPNKLICDISMQSSPAWRKKIIKSIKNSYRKSPFFIEVFPVLEELISYETDSLVRYLVKHISSLAEFLGIKTEIMVTSRCYKNSDMNGQERVIDICKRENATTYINPQGGQDLYDADAFRNECIDLQFISMKPIHYKQRTVGFVPYLSIIDPLMETGPDGLLRHIENFELQKKQQPLFRSEK